MDDARLDGVRQRVLRRIERQERIFAGLMGAGMAVEVAFFWGFVRLADFHNPTHALLFLSMGGTYVFLVIGLTALGVHISRIGRSILKAVQMPPAAGEAGPRFGSGLE